MLLKDLNPQQKQAVEHDQGPLLIVAGAGTGKTTVITQRVAWLIEQKKAMADEILALTFTDKAAGEMEERVDKLLPYGYVDLWIMTFHSFCQRVLQQHGLDIGIPNDFKLLNQTEQWMLVRQNLDKFNLEYYRPLGNPTKFIHALIKHFSRCKDEELWPQDYLEYSEKIKINQDKMESTGGEDVESEVKRLVEIANAYHVYQQLLLDNQALDFGDLINYTLKLFKTRPNILKKYQQQFKYILVDEFQDTNWAQYELVKLLVNDDKNLTVVGDDDQSIYKFRGASVSNILQFKDDFPKATEIYLNKNYRSTQDILDLAYSFIQLNNPERLEVKLTKTPKHKNTKTLSKKLQAETEEAGMIEHLHTSDESGEVEAVVNKIIELNNMEAIPSRASTRAEASWNDFAILVRANNQAEAFLNGLAYAGIPFNYIASKGLYTKEVILDVLAYLKLLDNYHESLALWRILNLPMIEIKVEDLMELTRFSNRKAYSLYEGLTQIHSLKNIEQTTRKKIEYILKKIKEHTNLAKEKSIKQVVLQFLKDFKYNEYLLKQNDEKSFSYLRQLIKKIEDFEKSNEDRSVANFMRLISFEMESGEQGDLSKELEEGPEAVKVMTIHSAKGLEFKYVFIVNLVDKRFPSMERREPIEIPDELVKEIIPTGDIHLQEERRLFYVAMTRAKRGLYFSSAENYGGKTKKKLSRFLYEINFTENTENTENIKAQKTPRESLGETTPKYSRRISENIREGLAKTIPTSFSYSQLKAFETCPYQYYLQFILKMPVKGKAVFSYGKTMHVTLQRFFSLIKQSADSEQNSLFSQPAEKRRKETLKNAEKLPPLDELLKIYQASWIDDWYESKQQKQDYKKQGEKSLKNLYDQIKDNLPQVLELEKGFNFKVDKYTIRGIIDRVDKLDNNQVEIIDYKTGRAKSEKAVEKDQLLMYQIAAQEVFNWPLEKLTFYYLDNNSAVSFLGSDKEIQKMKDKILKLINQILTSDWPAVASQHNCRYCDFSGICSFRK